MHKSGVDINPDGFQCAIVVASSKSRNPFESCFRGISTLNIHFSPAAQRVTLLSINVTTNSQCLSQADAPIFDCKNTLLGNVGSLAQHANLWSRHVHPDLVVSIEFH